jgi:hypothetical protein
VAGVFSFIVFRDNIRAGVERHLDDSGFKVEEILIADRRVRI